MKSTEAKPGKPIVMKLREDEEPQIMEWLNQQGMYSDSIRYLIQKEIAENGLRNLQLYVPQARTIETIKAQLASMPIHIPNHNATESSHVVTPPPSYQPTMDRESATMSRDVHHESPTASENSQSDRIVIKDPLHGEKSAHSYTENEDQTKAGTSEAEVLISRESKELESAEPVQEHSDKDDSASPGTPKRKAKKTFGSDVANSYAN